MSKWLQIARGPFIKLQLERKVATLEALSLRSLTPALDFWRLQTRHRRVCISICLTIRLLCQIDPLLIAARSSKVLGMILRGNFAHALDTSAAGFDTFISASRLTTSDFLEAVATSSKKRWRKTKCPDWLSKIVGSVAVCQYGPQSCDVALVFAGLDKGYKKYNLRCLDKFFTLAAICTAKLALIWRVMAKAVHASHNDIPRNGDARRLWFRALRVTIQACAKDSGIEPQLIAACQRFGTTMRARQATKAISVVCKEERRVEVEGRQDTLVQLQDKWSTAMSTRVTTDKRPKFVGPPLASSIVQSLAPAFAPTSVLNLGTLIVIALRQQQLRLELLATTLGPALTAIANGRPTNAPGPSSMPLGSQPWTLWFLLAREHTEI
ncbi:hypothetical protein Rhopal_006269-T1 [Rhodotorula paludigena]|uniref:Uncharacterized protein n=1 Tax=Rhodotorula paludigena TaxID=86838 RepID=A0AAV5GV47_9BASI|nr:hypothetical protein Rhopal_006269-T1 [Rhodotorula paludigena]